MQIKTRLMFSGLITAAAVAAIPAQISNGTWTEVTPDTDSPAPRQSFSMAYDTTRLQTVLFGGQGEQEPFGDTWAWDGAEWNEVATTGPSARSGQSMVYDSYRDRIVLFGGSTGGDETWEWNGSSWEQIETTTAPPARTGAAMAYDSSRHRVVLFGGFLDGGDEYSGSGYQGDTWEWDGSDWAQVATTGPSARTDAAMVYFPTTGRSVLFGGLHKYYQTEWFVATNMHDTWEWDGTNWAEIVAEGPSDRCGSAIAYDNLRDRVLLHGGEKITYIPIGPRFADSYDDLWQWDGTAWEQLETTGPGIRDHHAMVYNTDTERLTLFGGQYDWGTDLMNDTWEYAHSSQLPTPTPTPPPTLEPRALGDFNGDDCTNLGDYLVLLDSWQQDVNGTLMGLPDFLNLLDNWQTGNGCAD